MLLVADSNGSVLERFRACNASQVPWSAGEGPAAAAGEVRREPRGAVAKVPPPLAVTGLLGVPDGPCGGVFHGPLCVWTFLVPLKLSLSIAPWGPAWSAERGSGIKPPSSSASQGLHREMRCSGD